MGAVAAALRGRWAEQGTGTGKGGGFGEHLELDFLKGLANAFAGESCSFLPASSRRRDVRRYPVPDYLIDSGYEGAVNIAVTGNSGVGKSLFINTVRGVGYGEPTWSPVGVGDTTKDPVWYEFPKEPRVRLWDLEGALASDVPARKDPDGSSVDNYIRNIGLRYFDVVLVLSSGRLTETETEVTHELQACEVPFFFVRTKLDWDIENSEEDYGMTPEETIADIRKDLNANEVVEPYLVNARSVEEFDFPRLIRDVLLVVAGRWPDLVQQTLDDIAGAQAQAEPAAAEQPAAGEKHLGLLDQEMELYEGQEPVEALARYNGRWYWTNDTTWNDYLRAEVGEIAATVAGMLFSNADHTFAIHEDSRWEQSVLNAATGKTPLQIWIHPANVMTEEMEAEFFGNTVKGRGIEYILEGSKLVSEFIGSHEEQGKDGTNKIHFRSLREVVNGKYKMTNQNLAKGISGTRWFARWPYYTLVNEAEETISMSTYGGWSLMLASMTVDVPPGTHHISSSARTVDTEKAVFTLGNKKLTVPELKAFETFTLKKENFK